MNAKTASFFWVLAFVAFVFGEPANEKSSISDLRTQLIGTSRKAASGKPRPGLAAILTFTEANVHPAGYAYKVNANDSLTVSFNHGDTQLMLLDPDGKRLKFVFRNREYIYRLVPR